MPTITVKALPANGFYRAGRKWTNEPETVEVDAKTLAVLQAEPQLVVVVEVAKTKMPPFAEVSTDMNAGQAVERISRMTDAGQIRAFVKGDERKTVSEAAEAALEALK